MQPSISIKPYSSNYQKPIENIISSVIQELWLRFDPHGEEADIYSIPEFYLHDKGQFWILLENDNPAGTIALKPHPDGFYELKRFYILPRFRGKGYGKMLIKHLLDYARKNGVRVLRLDTNKKSKAAQRLFQSYGFYEIPKYLDLPYEQIYMELKL